MIDLDKEGFALLKLLVQVLQDANPSDPKTFITYTEAHRRLGIPILFGNAGRSLQAQGLNSLSTWTLKRGVPTITGLVVRDAERDPGPGYFKANRKREIEDVPWWLDEMRRAKETDWGTIVGEAVDTSKSHRPGDGPVPTSTASPPALGAPVSLASGESNENSGVASADLEEASLLDARRIANLIFARVAISGSTVEHTAPERTAPEDLVFNVLELLHAVPLVCYLCGGLMQIRPKNRLLQPSPDRIDSKLGNYERENMKLAHMACNLGKNAASVAEFEEWLKVMREN